jgi:FAD/FMN-containing dehydrogenase
MADTYVVTSNGDKCPLNEENLTDLKNRVRGELILPSVRSKYDEARKIWNAMIDRRPGLIVSCTGAGDVIQCVKFAKQHSLKVSVRGGGHSISGKCLLDGAMLIDLSQLRSVRVDVKNKIADVAPGALLGDVDHETKQFGLALPMGPTA